jgi:hypothetical protein
LLQFKAFKSTSTSLNLRYRDQRNHILETADCSVSKEWVAGFGFCQQLETDFYQVIGPISSLKQFCQKLGLRWLHGQTACRRSFG